MRKTNNSWRVKPFVWLMAAGILPFAGYAAEQTNPWAGGYVGLTAGRILSNVSNNFATYPTLSSALGGSPILPSRREIDSTRFSWSAKGGYNIPLNEQWLVGVALDASLSSVKGSTAQSGLFTGTNMVSGTPYSLRESYSIRNLATARALVGFAPTPDLLLYGSAGLAAARVKASSLVQTVFITRTGANEQTRVGWALGAGLRYRMSDRWDLDLEALHYDLGSDTITGSPEYSSYYWTESKFAFKGDIYRLGINYRFDEPSSLSKWVAPPQHGIDVGVRYWYSSGRSQYNLFNLDRSHKISKLTFDDLDANSAELFVRAELPADLYVKGVLGMGRITEGNLIDEDFPPVISPYSRTNSVQKNGTIDYLGFDLGWNLIAAPDYRIGLIAGYQYYHELSDNYGCQQLATSVMICGSDDDDSYALITYETQWHAMRLGLDADYRVTRDLKVSMEAAWLPLIRMAGEDTHWLRLGRPSGFSGPIPVEGRGSNGVQAQAVLSYRVTPAFSVALGARYWRMTVKGHVHFEDVGLWSGSHPQVADMSVRRSGVFAQAMYSF